MLLFLNVNSKYF